MSLAITRADAADGASMAEVFALLDEVHLPADGVAQHFSHFLLAHEHEQLIGCVGLEIYGEVALLRSLAVAPQQQRTGLGRRLTESILALARESGVREVVLLTTTAPDFFVNRFGFTPADRQAYDQRLAQSPEWNLPRCSSAILLKREM